MTRLLQKPLKAFAIYSLVILLVSIPVYFLVVDYIWISELDENNWLTLQHTRENLQKKSYSEEELEKISSIWGDLHPGVSLIKLNERPNFQDSVFEAIRPNLFDVDDGEDRFRGLISYMELNGDYYRISVETNVEESDETVFGIAAVTLIFFILLVGGFMILNRLIASKTWKPFYQTLEQLKAFNLSKDQTINFPNSDILEFQEMNQSLKSLVGKNVDVYRLQKSFTENASHELQTPIALLKSKLDILLQERDLSPETLGLLEDIQAPLSRLSRINKNLLVLAKVENLQLSESEELDVMEFVQISHVLFEDYLEEKDIQLNIENQNSISVVSNSFLLETLIHNLFSNAIRHSSKGSSINIKLHNRVLSFSNSGENPLDSNRLFERFSSSTKSKVSSGLGLAIVKEIVSQNGWEIRYRFRNGFHSFELTFPNSKFLLNHS